MAEAIQSRAAPEAVGPYSQAIRSGDRLYISGQVGMSPVTQRLVEGGVVAETRQALDNVSGVLGSAGFSIGDVVQVQIFLTKMDDYHPVNAEYGSWVKDPLPARATIAVSALPLGAKVEIVAVAERGDGRD